MDVLADSNIILRRLHRAHPQHREARDAITKLNRVGNRLCVASQNLIEVWAVATRPVEQNGLGLGPAQADKILSRIEGSAFRLPESTKFSQSGGVWSFSTVSLERRLTMPG